MKQYANVMLKKHFVLSVLKTVDSRDTFSELNYLNDIESSKEQCLVEIVIFCKNVKLFTIKFY